MLFQLSLEYADFVLYTICMQRKKLGKNMGKILLLLGGGLALGLSRTPKVYFRIVRGMVKEWKNINREALHDAIRILYASKLIESQENSDGTVTLVLTKTGKEEFLRYNIDTIAIQKPKKWDEIWRLVLFDIPEPKKIGRDVFARKLKQLGFYPLQKSAFIFPYVCEKELDFIIESFDLRPYVRILHVKDTDIDFELKTKFHL